jgi:hypothetical protein
MEELGAALRESSELASLQLYGNVFTPTGAVLLAQALLYMCPHVS